MAFTDARRPSPSTPASARAARQSGVAGAVLVLGLLAGSALRVVLLPTQGLKGYLDQFAFWIGEIARLEPQRVYFPLGVGNHVDHQLMREAAMALLADERRWVMPGPDYIGAVAFSEDFPYAWWNGFTRLEDLPAGALAGLPSSVSLTPEFADVGDQLERKITGISIYESQLDNLFGGRAKMAEAVRSFGAATALLGGIDGHAERYWVTTRV